MLEPEIFLGMPLSLLLLLLLLLSHESQLDLILELQSLTLFIVNDLSR